MSENTEKEYHTHHHSHSSSHHRHKHHKHHKFYRLWRRDDNQISRSTKRMLSLFSIVLFFAVGFLVYRGINKWEMAQYVVPKSVIASSGQPKDTIPKTVFADGVRYEYRQNLEAYLLMGIDVSGTVESMSVTGNGGQADVQIVLVVDNDNRTWQVLQLNRDTLTDIPVLGIGGKLIGYQRKQLALAHFYGSGRQDSCQNTVDAVSSLMWDQPFAGYISMNMDGIGVVNDAIGGVEVNITTDFTGIDETLELGADVLLTGEQAVTFLRSRMGVDDGTNIARMSRHRQYLEALTQKLLDMDNDTIVNAFTAAEDYIVSNMNPVSIAALVEKLDKYQQCPILTVDGTATVANGVSEFEMDKVSFQNVMLTLLYQEQKG